MLFPPDQSLLAPPQDEAPQLPRGGSALIQRMLWIITQGVLIWASFQIYKIARRSFIPPDAKVAFDNAHDIIRVEDKLGLFFELEWQRWALDRADSYIKTFNYLYAYYMWWVIGGLMLVAFLAPVRYRYMRRAFYISMLLVTPMYLIYPLAPPRFMGAYGWPFVDTLAVYGPNYFSETGLVQANRYAAMPSMHVGWTTFVAVSFSLLIANPKLRAVLMAMAASIIFYIVIITGNHYWLDAMVGWATIALALVINRAVPYPLFSFVKSKASAKTS